MLAFNIWSRRLLRKVAEEPEVTRDDVLRALRAAKPPHVAKIVHVAERDGWYVAISNDDFATVQYIPPNPSRRTINRLHLRFGIPREWFYEPLTVPKEDETRPN